MVDLPPLRAALDHIGICSPAPQRLAAFYGQALKLELRPMANGLRGEAPGRRIHFLPGPPKTLGYAAFRVEAPEELARLAGRISLCGWPTEAPPASDFIGAFCVRDPDGNRLVFGMSPCDEPSGPARDAPSARLQHVVVASRDPERIATFYAEVLGFDVSDHVVDEVGAVRTTFLRCGPEHHSFAVFRAAEDRLDHHCYETASWNDIRDWSDHMAALGIPLVWGPGRHGPGSNLFMFINDPDGNWVEFSAELEIVAQDRPVGVWPHEERTLNTWGRGLLRS